MGVAGQVEWPAAGGTLPGKAGEVTGDGAGGALR